MPAVRRSDFLVVIPAKRARTTRRRVSLDELTAQVGRKVGCRRRTTSSGSSDTSSSSGPGQPALMRRCDSAAKSRRSAAKASSHEQMRRANCHVDDVTTAFLPSALALRRKPRGLVLTPHGLVKAPREMHISCGAPGGSLCTPLALSLGHEYSEEYGGRNGLARGPRCSPRTTRPTDQHACPLASLSLSLSLSGTGDAGGRSRGAAPVPLAPARVTATLHYPVARNRGRVSLNERYDKVCMRRACQMRIKCDAETRCTRYFSVSILPAPN